jgi:hypothetical protein
MYSGGICSWATAHRLLIGTAAPDDMLLLFCDTKAEDEDLYRFIVESSEKFMAELVWLEDGRSIWEVFKAVKFMGNSRIDPCSRILKRELADKWVAEHYQPDECIVYLGIDWSESHRIERLRPRKLPYRYEAPMCDPPYLTKQDMLDVCRGYGVEPPRLYEMGFMHNNCGGFCIRSGQAQFRKLWLEKPDYYIECENAEQEVFETIGKEQPFLRVTEGGELKYLSLKTFREEYLVASDKQIDLFDWGGCGCFLDEATE